ncbi:DNA-binding protein [Brevibacterium samyangense]|uniref:DNA-binding protein n=1 Tax=Brevibacterium samyangense TaxID=366888 RepID=A0ABN2TFE3_9MICO
MTLLERARALADRIASRDTEEGEELHRASRVDGAVPMNEVQPRAVCTVAGVVVAVTRSVPGEAPQLSVDLSDGTGVVSARFLGRREITGIAPGRVLVLEGRFCSDSGGLVALNPAYRLIGSERAEPRAQQH